GGARAHSEEAGAHEVSFRTKSPRPPPEWEPRARLSGCLSATSCPQSRRADIAGSQRACDNTRTSVRRPRSSGSSRRLTSDRTRPRLRGSIMKDGLAHVKRELASPSERRGARSWRPRRQGNATSFATAAHDVDPREGMHAY